MARKSVLELNLSWKDVVNTNKKVLVPLHSAAEEVAKSQGVQYFIRGHKVYDRETLFVIGSISDLRIHLSVPYKEKEEAKKVGGKWDSTILMWYGRARDSDLRALAKWTHEDERTYIHCPPEYTQFAIHRGALQAKEGRLFIPTWYWLDGSLENAAKRLCYWLPPNHAEYHAFNNDREAAISIAMSGGYTPIHAYLPSERKHLEALCDKGTVYIYKYIYNGKDYSYFRWKVWDQY